MDFFSLLFLICLSIFIGIVLTLVIQYYVLVRYFHKGPVVDAPKKLNAEAYSLPEALKKKLDEEISSETAGSSLPISLMLQFLFHELRHSDSIKRWLFKKLSLEFDELLTKTTIGKFFDSVTIRDMHLGTQFPDISDIKLDSINLDKTEGHIDTLNLSIKLDYTGNFLLSIDAKMKFGKTAYLSIKVKHISGVARLQFTRIPYTHWSFTFYTEPVMELAVESHFQGRQLQSNITNLIVNQIKKAIKRKHTMPNYKIRYKPFFVKTDPGQLDIEENEIVPQGNLEISCTEVSRLAVSSEITSVYCTLTIDTIPFICIYQKENTLWMILELTIVKGRQQHLGVIFKQEQNAVIVDSVSPQTPAANAGLKPGDVLLAVENKNVSTVSQIGKIIKSISSVNLSVKVERSTSNYIFRTKNYDKTEEKTPTISLNDEDSEQDSFVVIDKLEETPDTSKKVKCLDKLRNDRVPKLIYSSNENMSKFAQTLGNFSLRKRKTSAERTSNDSSNKSTPNQSCPSTPQHVFKAHAINLPTNFILTKKHSLSEVPEIIQTDPENQETELLHLTDVHRGRDVPCNNVIPMSDEYNFNLKEAHKYLNVNVWGIANGKDELLGYTNIPLTEILSACCNSLLGHYIRSYSFLPPNNTPPNSQTHPLMSHSGFEHVFCYGDILMSFVWNHEDSIEIKRKNSALAMSELEIKEDEKQITSHHDFIRTQFHRTIHCDFCSKKIWLKDAVRCRDCGLCCHKKCIAKCQLSTDCTFLDKSILKSDLLDQIPPDINISDGAGGDDGSLDEDSHIEVKEGISAIKRVNSVTNLSIPGSHLQSTQTRSLPPTPQRTPSRKQSLVMSAPFSLCPTVLEEIQSESQDASEVMNRLLDHIMLYSTDENLMEIARESGRQLYSNMPAEEKIEKINAMMGELKKLFDVVTNDHADLCKKMNNEDDEVEKAKLAFLLGQADSKIHGISVLMLHFCSGLQQN